MNIELEVGKSNLINEVNLKDAKRQRDLGDDAVKTSCLLCKFKPECLDAIPFYHRAADLYKGAALWSDELYCREKLIYCHRYLNSAWEEGNEHEKSVYIYLNLSKFEEALTSVQNAYNCFFLQGDYKDAVNSCKKSAQAFIDQKEFNYAEKCLKISYDAFLQVFHTLATKKDEPYDFLYTSLDLYLAVLVKNDKLRNALESCENVIKVIEPLEENRNNISHLYGFLLLCLILNGDEIQFSKKVEDAKNGCTKNSEIRYIQNIEFLFKNIKDTKEDEFKDCMIEINIDYPIEVTKRINDHFKEKKSKLNNNLNSIRDHHGDHTKEDRINNQDQDNDWL